MSVTEVTEQAEVRTSDDLRGWLGQVEEIGELHTIESEVDPVEEMAATTYLAAQAEDAPAILFTNVRGSRPGSRALFNMVGSSLRRYALAFGLDPGLDALTLVQATRDLLRRRVAPVTVDANRAPLNETVLTGADIDLESLPVPQHWPLDGGRYIGTADVVLTRDPDLGHVNMGTYRMMLHDRNHVGLYLSPGKDARLHVARSWEQGKDVEVVAVYGVHPLWMILGSQAFPKNLSELDAVGGVLGRPFELVNGTVNDLPIPAAAEIAIEGVIHVGATRPEGPFGEFTGYYGRPEGSAPLVEVTAVHLRREPILTNALMADHPSCEMGLFNCVARSARLWDDLDRLGIPGIRGVWAPPEAASAFGVLVVSLEQRYAGHAAQVLALAAQAPATAYFTKWIIAVDEDVDPTDFSQVLWALSTRCSPANDIDVLHDTWSTWLDPTLNPPEIRAWGSKGLINACREHRYLAQFSTRTALSSATFERVASRWSRDFGLPGEAPRPLAFEGGVSDLYRYHETGERLSGRENGASSL